MYCMGILSVRFHYHKNASFYTHLFSLFPVLWKMATTVMEEKFLNEEKESYEPTSCFCQGKLLLPGLLCTVYYKFVISYLMQFSYSDFCITSKENSLQNWFHIDGLIGRLNLAHISGKFTCKQLIYKKWLELVTIQHNY